MPLSDKLISKQKQIDYIPVTSFQGIGVATTVLDSIGTGDAVTQAINSLAQTGLLMAAAGDDIHHFMRIPTHWDRNNNIDVRVVYTTGSSEITDGITWKFLYNMISPETTDTIVIPATACDTAIAEDFAAATAYAVQKSPAGVINSGAISTTDEFMSFLVEMDAFDAGLSEDKLLLGVEFEYTHKLALGVKYGDRPWVPE